MKKITLILLALGCYLPFMAQRLCLYQGNITWVKPLLPTDTLTWDSPERLSINQQFFTVSQIDSITIDNEKVTPNSVLVHYQSKAAHITLPFDLSTFVTLETEGNNIRITPKDDLEREITYTLQGQSANGSFTLGGNYKSTLILNGLDLVSQKGSAIAIEHGKRLTVILKDGTTNRLTDQIGGEQKACFFVHGHAEFKGNGKLELTGRSKHAYASDEYTLFKKSFGQLSVLSAVSDGLHINQYFQQNGGLITVRQTQGDGVDVGATHKEGKEHDGEVFLNGGQLQVYLQKDNVKGLKCDSSCTISGGKFIFEGKGDGIKGLSVDRNLVIQNGEETSPQVLISVEGTTYHKGQEDESKCRGIKVKGNFYLKGGNVQVTAKGKKAKAIKVDGTYTKTGGTINVPVDAASIN